MAKVIPHDWRTVVGFPNYEVNQFGHVRRVKAAPGTWSGRILKPTLNKSGYPSVSLWVNGKRTAGRVHVMVARAFLGEKPSELHEVAHWDGNRANPVATNLRWALRAENHADKVRHGTANRGQKHGLAKLTNRQARQIIALRKNGSPLKKLAGTYGVHVGTIRKLLSGESWAWLER